ncbi:MAG: hypothetical protein H6Q14_1563 [Bacteroidetes bacterium]|nr:hypothetical protein [Bacteroidota bacterium]
MKPLKSFILLFPILLCACHDEDDSSKSISEQLGTHYSNYRLLDDNTLEDGDTIAMKLGDSIVLYVDNDKNATILLDENHPAYTMTNNGKGYVISSLIADPVKADVALVVSDIGQLTFYIKIIPRYNQIILFNPPRSTVDIENLSLKSAIQNELDSLSPKLLDEYDFVFLTKTSGTVKYTNRKTTTDTLTGEFSYNGDNNLLLYYDGHLKYNYTLVPYQESDSVVYTHYLKEDFTSYFRLKYPNEEINEVTTASDCIKYKLY